MRLERSGRRFLAILVAVVSVFLGAGGGLYGVCGPFTDVAADAFCSFVLEIFYLGITTGTTPTTYDPSSNVSRLQMAAFLSRTVDRTLQRGSRRAALNQFWASRANLATTTFGQSAVNAPHSVASDGADLWVSSNTLSSVQRVRASDGKLLESWTGALNAAGVLSAMGQIFVAGRTAPGRLYWIDPSKPAGSVVTVSSTLASNPVALAFDGSRIFTADNSGAVTIVEPGATIPWTVTSFSAEFQSPNGILYDGANIWITDSPAGTLLKLDANDFFPQTVTVGLQPAAPVFDGSNIWVPNSGSNSVSVVRASNLAVLATLTGNGLNNPLVAAFDGQRVLVTNSAGNSLSLWKAADLTAVGSFSTGTSSAPNGACSDGINFWIALGGVGKLARF